MRPHPGGPRDHTQDTLTHTHTHQNTLIVSLQVSFDVSHTCTQVFADSLVAEAKADAKVQVVHAAMGGGTGINHFEKFYPERVYDVGIAEQHAVTFAAGLACEGLAPFCTIYSTFLQRGYDQVCGRVCRLRTSV